MAALHYPTIYPTIIIYFLIINFLSLCEATEQLSAASSFLLIHKQCILRPPSSEYHLYLLFSKDSFLYPLLLLLYILSLRYSPHANSSLLPVVLRSTKLSSPSSYAPLPTGHFPSDVLQSLRTQQDLNWTDLQCLKFIISVLLKLLLIRK